MGFGEHHSEEAREQTTAARLRSAKATTNIARPADVSGRGMCRPPGSPSRSIDLESAKEVRRVSSRDSATKKKTLLWYCWGKELWRKYVLCSSKKSRWVLISLRVVYRPQNISINAEDFIDEDRFQWLEEDEIVDCEQRCREQIL